MRLELQPHLDPELFASAEALFCDNIELSRGRAHFGVPIEQPTSYSGDDDDDDDDESQRGRVAGAFGYVLTLLR